MTNSASSTVRHLDDQLGFFGAVEFFEDSVEGVVPRRAQRRPIDFPAQLAVEIFPD
jgi:hypothetical protein